MLLIHESEVIPENLSWDESFEVIQQYLSENDNVHYYARPRESFSLKEAAVEAARKGCDTVMYDNLS